MLTGLQRNLSVYMLSKGRQSAVLVRVGHTALMGGPVHTNLRCPYDPSPIGGCFYGNCSYYHMRPQGTIVGVRVPLQVKRILLERDEAILWKVRKEGNCNVRLDTKHNKLFFKAFEKREILLGMMLTHYELLKVNFEFLALSRQIKFMRDNRTKKEQRQISKKEKTVLSDIDQEKLVAQVAAVEKEIKKIISDLQESEKTNTDLQSENSRLQVLVAMKTENNEDILTIQRQFQENKVQMNRQIKEKDQTIRTLSKKYSKMKKLFNLKNEEVKAKNSELRAKDGEIKHLMRMIPDDNIEMDTDDDLSAKLIKKE